MVQNPTPRTARRRGLAALVVAAVAAGAATTLAGGGSSERDTAGPAPAAASATPGAAPSSGPTGTPDPGDLSPVATRERKVLAPVPLTRRADFGTGVTLQVTDVQSVTGEARGPGEIAGPAVRMAVRLSNGSRHPVSLESVVLALDYGPRRTPAATLSGPDAAPFGGELAPGAQRSAAYVFAVPDDARSRLRLTASYLGDVPAVALTGAVR